MKLHRVVLAACAGVALIAAHAGAQDSTSLVIVRLADAGPKPTGLARLDFIRPVAPEQGGNSVQDAVDEAAVQKKKSPWLAAGLSLVVPGAGEFYADNYWRSAAFFAVEIAAWTVAYIYDKKADRQNDFFQSFADQHWSVVRYGQYAETALNPPNKPYNWLIPNTEGAYPWQRVNWAELNRMERDIGGYYSHTLPRYGEQQYYELIGKYPQFNQGWDDSPPTFNYGDALTARFTWYADQRGKANSFYETATTWVTIAIVNHIVSAVDAAFAVGSYNGGLHASIGTRMIPTVAGVKSVPVVQIRYGF